MPREGQRLGTPATVGKGPHTAAGASCVQRRGLAVAGQAEQLGQLLCPLRGDVRPTAVPSLPHSTDLACLGFVFKENLGKRLSKILLLPPFPILLRSFQQKTNKQKTTCCFPLPRPLLSAIVNNYHRTQKAHPRDLTILFQGRREAGKKKPCPFLGEEL